MRENALVANPIEIFVRIWANLTIFEQWLETLVEQANERLFAQRDMIKTCTVYENDHLYTISEQRKKLAKPMQSKKIYYRIKYR